MFETVANRYRRLSQEDTDIKPQFHLLRDLAAKCNHVTEMGFRYGTSATAFYFGLCQSPGDNSHKKLVCYDIVNFDHAPFIAFSRQSNAPQFQFVVGDSRKVEIEETDLLFLDTAHNKECIEQELRLHAAKTRRWVAIHDTKAFAVNGTGGGGGMQVAIDEFVSQGLFEVQEVNEELWGLTVLRRRDQ